MSYKIKTWQLWLATLGVIQFESHYRRIKTALLRGVFLPFFWFESHYSRIKTRNAGKSNGNCIFIV